MPASSSSSTSCQRLAWREPGALVWASSSTSRRPGLPGQRGVEIELLRVGAVVLDRLPGVDLQPLDQPRGLRAAVGLDEADESTSSPSGAWRAASSMAKVLPTPGAAPKKTLRWLPRKPNCLPSTCRCKRVRTRSALTFRARATRSTWSAALAGEICGSSPDAGTGHHVSRQRSSSAVLLADLSHGAGDEGVGELPVGGTLVGARGGGGIVAVAGRGWARMEVSRLGEYLPYELASDHSPIHSHQRAVGLVGKEHLGKAPSRFPGR